MRTLCLIIIFAFCGIATVFSQASFNIKNTKVCRAQTTKILVDLNNSVDIRAFQMHIILPECIRLSAAPRILSNRVGTYIDEFGNKQQSSVTLSYRLKDDGSVIIVANSVDAIPFKGNQGSIIEIPVVVHEQAVNQIVDVEIKDVELVRIDGFSYISPEDKICSMEVLNEVTSIDELKQLVGKYVDVFAVDGKLVKKNCPVGEMDKGLAKGVYVIEGIKVIIR